MFAIANSQQRNNVSLLSHVCVCVCDCDAQRNGKSLARNTNGGEKLDRARYIMLCCTVSESARNLFHSRCACCCLCVCVSLALASEWKWRAAFCCCCRSLPFVPFGVIFAISLASVALNQPPLARHNEQWHRHNK